MVTLNPDGVSIEGCTIIYAPAGQAAEYAPLACNPYRGCGMGCAYCYVPDVIYMTRPDFDAGAVPRKDFLKKIRKDAAKYQALGSTEQVFFCFTTDLYNPFDTTLTRPSLETVIEHGLAFCVLSKGGEKALTDIDLFRPDRDAFAATLTSTDEAFAAKWERRAAPPASRMKALQRAHERGIFTWISLEPTLDIDASLEVVRATASYVDLYKVGRANYLKEITRTTDWRGYTLRMIELLNRLGKKHYIKKDLQPFLPSGYFNPLRVAQHHGIAA